MGECIDTNVLDGVVITDSYGDGCAEYANNIGWCGNYDSENFLSTEMCCACGGGETVEEEE